MMARSRSPLAIGCTQQSLRLPERQPVTGTDALCFRTLHPADASGQFRREQPVVRSLGSQLTNR
jgi:hypothetical protein